MSGWVAERRTLFTPALLFLLTLAAYLPALRAAWVWDDPQHVTANPTLRSLDGLRRIWREPSALPQYYPLVHTSFWIEYRLWGPWPAGYHLLNVLLHALGAVLAGRALGRLAVPGALLSAIVFALHPVHVESVAWVTERKNVLSGALYLGSLLACIRHFGLDGRPRPASRRLWWTAFALFVCALLAKTVAASLPAAVIVLLWLKGRGPGRRDLGELAPFFAAGLILGLNTAALERQHVGAVGPEWDLSLAERALVAGRALWFYLGTLAWPRDLSFIYPRWVLDPRAPAQWAYPAAAVTVLALLWLFRGRLGRGPLAAALLFGLTLAPALGFFDVYPMRFSFVADHFQYLASLAPIALAGAAVASAAGRFPPGARRASAALAAVLALALGTLTFQRARAFHDEETLWRDTLAKNPGCWLCLNNLGGHLVREGRLDEAAGALERAVRLKPDYVEARINLGVALARMDEAEAARRQFAAALELQPTHVAALYNLGHLLATQGRLEEAISILREAVRVEPGSAIAQQDLGRALALQGRLEEAVGPLSLGLAARPRDAEAHRELGHVFTELGRFEDAETRFSEALALDPRSPGARYGLARMRAARGDVEGAVRELTVLLRLQPDFGEAKDLLESLRRSPPVPARRPRPSPSPPSK